MSVLLLGDGYHNSHHAFPAARASAAARPVRRGLCAAALAGEFGLVGDIIVPSPNALEVRRRRSAGVQTRQAVRE
jgi:fatty-acid desaturase